MYGATGFIASLLKLPVIQEISGCFGDTWDDERGEINPVDKYLIELDSASSPLTTLDLVVCALSKADLGHMLRAPKAPKTPFYKVCPPAYIRFTDICHALLPQKSFFGEFWP